MNQEGMEANLSNLFKLQVDEREPKPTLEWRVPIKHIKGRPHQTVSNPNFIYTHVFDHMCSNPWVETLSTLTSELGPKQGWVRLRKRGR